MVAKALVTDIEKMRKSSPNGQLQANDILNYFCGGQNVCTPYHLGLKSLVAYYQLVVNMTTTGATGRDGMGPKLVSYR